MTTVSELIAYLQTQPQHAIVQTLVGEQGRDWQGDHYHFQELVISEHINLCDLRGNQWVPETSRNFNKGFLEIGTHP
jgi:hypothetical protein